MATEERKYFRYLDLIREDIREEFNPLGINPARDSICDFGCGNGITTFGLALESQDSECIGIDLFGKESKIAPQKINDLVARVKMTCKDQNKYFQDVCALIRHGRVPTFQQGNIVTNQNLPQDIDLVYCKKLLVNIYGKEYPGVQSGELGLLAGLRNIARSLRPQGQLCVIEYDNDFMLESTLEKGGFQIQKKDQITRNEIRSEGRTEVESLVTLYLCSKWT